MSVALFFVVLVIGIIILATFLLLTSSIKIEVIKLKTKVEDLPIKGTVEEYLLEIRLCIFGKISVYKKRIKIKETDKEFKSNKIIKWLDKQVDFELENLLKDTSKTLWREKNKIFTKRNLELLKNMRGKLRRINAKVEIGTENAAVTSYLVSIISTVISVVLMRKVSIKESEKFQYQVRPNYIGQNFIKMELRLYNRNKNGTYYLYNN